MTEDEHRGLDALTTRATRLLEATVDLCIACGVDMGDGQKAVNRMPYPLHAEADPDKIAPAASAVMAVLHDIAWMGDNIKES